MIGAADDFNFEARQDFAKALLVSFAIPDIPESFQILMGISNGVYVGTKVAQT